MNNNDDDESKFWIQLCEINEEQNKEEKERKGKSDSFISYFIKSKKEAADEKKFWCLLLEESNRFTRFILSLNIVILVIFISFHIFYFKKFDSSSRETIYWILSSLLCLYFTPNPKKMLISHNAAIYRSWKLMGYFIIYLRCNQIFLRIYKVYSSDFINQDMCSKMENLIESDVTVIIPVKKFLIDTVQSLIFTSISFPFPFTPLFVVCEATLQIFRLTTCLPRANLNNNPAGNSSLSINSWVLFLSIISIIVFQIGVIFFYFAKINAQRNNLKYALQIENEIEEKKSFIDLLCSETKISLQKVLLNSCEVEANIVEKEKVILNKVVIAAFNINLIADNILNLMKIHESRLNYNCSSPIKLDEMVHNVFFRYARDSDYNTSNIVDTKVFNEVIYSDLICVEMIVRNMIYFAFEMKKKILKNIHLKGNRVLFNATLNKNHSNFSSHILAISVTCKELEFEVDSINNLKETTEVNDFETIYTSCKSISEIFRGKFYFSPGRIEISICCQGNKWESVLLKKIENKDEEEKEKWKGGINFAKVTVLINDKNEIDIIKPILHEFNIKHSIEFIEKSDLYKILMDTDVVFISNENILNTLKSLDYENYIILISSSIHYLNSSTLNFVDFILPFPYSKQDTNKLKSWFDSPTKIRISNLESIEYKNRFSLSTGYFSFKMNRFSPDIEISFMQWRVLNPTKSFFHVSKLVDVSYFVFTISITFQTLFTPANEKITSPLINMIGTFLIWFIVSLRGTIFNFFSQILNINSNNLNILGKIIKFLYSHVTIRTFWTSAPIIISFTIIIRVFAFYIYFRKNIFEFHNINDLLDLDYDFYALKINGTVLFIQLIMQSYATFIWGMNIPWPYSFVFLFSLFLRSMVIHFFILRYIIDNEHDFLIILSLQILYYLYVVIHMYHFEDTQRNEFRKYRIRNQSRMSIRNSIRLCQKDMKHPLNNILTYYKLFLLQLEKRLKDYDLFNFEKGKLLINDVNSLYSPIHLLNEINFLFLYKNKETDNHKRSVNQADNFKKTNPMLIDIILLKYELQRIAYIFQTCKLSISLDLKIYLIVDSELSLIKTNKKVLFSIITNAISVAIKKINYKIEIDTDIRGKEVHNIIIHVRSIDYSGLNSKPFFHIRYMVIDVYDTGYPISNQMKMFGSSICQQMRDDMYLSNNNEVLKIKKSQEDFFNHSIISSPNQRIIFPYLLHEMTLKVGMIFKSSVHDAFAFDCFNISQLGMKLKLYDDWNTQYSSKNTHNHSMCFVCPIEDKNSKLNQNEFFCHGWKLDKVNYIDQITLEPSLLQSNAIVIDYSTYKVKTEISFFFSNSNSFGLDYTCNFLRLLGYKGLIVVLFASVDKYEECVKETYEMTSYNKNETDITKDYTVIYQPILDIALNNLVKLCLFHEISMLLNPNLITLH